ncbi:exosome-associated factor Rrp47/DNA strand repair C1D [Terfezia boudieri ATCC MYA-4762]|uniref:Exosome complex protein n=1 Tax=Terfezia boudieri ATCC MYA-4762 TaxID=1051890 RepID=A0A3N4LD63_9PEZI|nr:exosome-associated factor Rrp47/DNA strand repair C1D [Terfezia boudieri ATCC MYA-4762]
MESDLQSLVEDLDDHLADLTDAIDPLLTHPISESASKLPLVDKAKLHVIHVYALESLLFSYLRLNGIKTKDHPIMRELTRVKQYMAKIKDAEENAARQDGAGARLDKEAAGRFIKHALAANERMDRLAKEKEAKEDGAGSS